MNRLNLAKNSLNRVSGVLLGVIVYNQNWFYFLQAHFLPISFIFTGITIDWIRSCWFCWRRSIGIAQTLKKLINFSLDIFGFFGKFTYNLEKKKYKNVVKIFVYLEHNLFK